MNGIDHTHAADARSWVESARRPGTDFPIQNLPFGVFCRRAGGEPPRVGVAIGDEIFDLGRAAASRHLEELTPGLVAAANAESLNPMMALGREAIRAVRHRLFALLSGSRPAHAELATCLVPMTEAELLLPAAIGDYSDFYASIDHATNVGSMFRPDNPLLPNYKHVPIGYHGRASSIVVSGTPVRRPSGQVKDEAAPMPVFAATRALDYECEVGAFLGPGNALGTSVPLTAAEAHLFGLCLVNDWSARDIQRWEYQPLGPFLAKSFATSVSPWVVTLDALAPYRVPAAVRPAADPAPLAYLAADADRSHGGFALTVEVWLASARMRDAGVPPMQLSRADFSGMYWTVAQMLTHHASNGCNLRPGDLIASGTVSGPARENRGCLLELTWRGSEPISLPGGETRRFLEDGDEVILRGHCEREGFARIGLGECRGMVIPSR